MYSRIALVLAFLESSLHGFPQNINGHHLIFCYCQNPYLTSTQPELNLTAFAFYAILNVSPQPQPQLQPPTGSLCHLWIDNLEVYTNQILESLVFYRGVTSPGLSTLSSGWRGISSPPIGWGPKGRLQNKKNVI